MSGPRPSARWSISLVAPRQRSLHCRRCHSGRASIRVFTEAEAEAELEAADRAGAHLVAMGETGYPPALTYVDAPPPLLYAKSRLELAAGPIVAMVGACNGSAVGRNSHASLPPSSGSKASSSLRDLREASTLTLPRLSAVPSPFLPVAWQSGGLGNRFKLVNQRGDILRSLSPCHIGFR